MTQKPIVGHKLDLLIWRKLSIQIKLLVPVIIALVIAFVVLASRVPPPINALVESNVRSNFTTRLTELRTPIIQFLQAGQKDLLTLVNGPDLANFLAVQTGGDKTEIAVAQSGLTSMFVGKITEGQIPYSDIRYVTLDGKQLARATARQIGGVASGVLLAGKDLATENISAYIPNDNSLTSDSVIVLPVRMSKPNSDSGLSPEPIIELAAPVISQSKTVGFIIGSLRARDFLIQTFQQTGKTVSYQSVLADQSGQVIALTNPTVPEGVSVWGDPAATQLESHLPIETIDGTAQDLQAIQDRVYVSLSLNKIGDPFQNHLLIIVNDDLNSVYAGARDLETTLFVTLGIVFLIAIGGIGFISQSIIRPLVEVSRTADRVSAGDLEAKAPVASGDEVGMVALALNTMSSRLSELIRTLEQRVHERTRNIEIAAEISRDTAQLTSLNNLLQRTVNEVRDRFGLYHAQIFLSDDQNEYAVLVIGTGEPATRMLADGHKLQIGSASIVGQAVQTGLPVKTLDTQQGEVSHRYNPYLPNTRSELAVPLRIGDTAIGALDIQSSEANAFSAEDEKTFQMIANQLAIAVDNVRLFERSQEARRLADEANRQKSEFLSNMSHELRTPLNVIIGYSHSILTRPAMYDDVPLPEAYSAAVESIRSSGQHLFGLINDILDLSKIEAGKIDLDIKPIDVVPVMEGVRSTALGLIKKDVQLRVEHSSKLPNLLGDELRIRQILLNLLSNAAKFTSVGFITINAVVRGEMMQFSIADTGRGIPDEVKPYIFERFQQGSNTITKQFGGSGLGLNISRQLTRMQGGEMWFKSEVGQGSVFYFTIPLAPSGMKMAAPYSVPVSPLEAVVGSSRAHIFVPNAEEPVALQRQLLLVDTNSETRAILETALNQVGYSVLSTDNQDRALNVAAALAPEVVVIHLHVNDLDQMKSLPAALHADESLAFSSIIVVDDDQLQEPQQDALRDLVLEQLQAKLGA